ncbi:50S ribosome-binding GTPase [Intrasporangium calvum]|uniref:50S ribosome-binding GTPase n=1 Tax=Intrasporangium calvum TaxID=53358 RepID=A0ABT5GFE1_9MICO|nr:GTPase domain-containing protein [Intrasporangium calvum]MDC5696827.1 50S ribosome-binding GTPase [Intrasporangium calvum]
MTDLLYHSAPAAVRDLSERLAKRLAKLPADEGARLQALLMIHPHERPRMVLTGQYSSGKSTLIHALTDEGAEVVIDSAVATDTVDVFDWDGLVDLVDTPGVQAGLDRHDDLAEEALRSADLVLFTVTVDLFDDRLVSHLRHVTEDLRKAPQLLVVVTKSRSLAAAQGVREAAVREALGIFADRVPWVECDAKTYIDGLHEVDPARAARRIEASNLPALKDLINTIARERGDLARFRVPLQQVALVAGEALASLANDANEEAVLAVLARQRRALTNRRDLVDSALERQATEFRTTCIRAAERLADAAESIEDADSPDWSQLEPASQALNDELNVANERFLQGVREVLDFQLSDFTSEVREIEASPYAHQLTELVIQGDVGAEPIAVDAGMTRPKDGKPGRSPAWGREAAKHLKKFSENWGAGEGVKKAAGSPGHKIVYNVGKHVGIKFKPYQAVRWANNIGRIAKVGSVVLPVALEAYAVVRDEREEQKATREKVRRRNSLIANVLSQSDDIARRTLVNVREELNAEFGAAIREIDEVNRTVLDNRAMRGELDRDIRAIQVEAHAMLDRLDVGAIG